MSQKYHINAKGVPAPCRAKKGNCPFGGEDGTENHFDTMEEAEFHANQQGEAEFGIIPNMLPNENDYKYKGAMENSRLKMIDKLEQEHGDIRNSDKFNKFLKENYRGEQSLDGMSNEEAFDHFMENHGKRLSVEETMYHLTANAGLANSLKDRIYNENNNYRFMIDNEPYEFAFEDWSDENIKSVDDLVDVTISSQKPVWEDYNTPQLTEVMQDFYNGQDKDSYYVVDKVHSEGFKQATGDFIDDYYNEKVNEGYSEAYALEQTVEFFAHKTKFAENQKEAMYNDTTGRYLMESEPYEIAFEDWSDSKVKNVNDLKELVLSDEASNNNYNFINNIERYYGGRGIKASFRSEVEEDGFNKAYENFIRRFQRERQNEELLEVLQKYD